jgi:hypothetical protein
VGRSQGAILDDEKGATQAGNKITKALAKKEGRTPAEVEAGQD